MKGLERKGIGLTEWSAGGAWSRPLTRVRSPRISILQVVSTFLNFKRSPVEKGTALAACPKGAQGVPLTKTGSPRTSYSLT